MVLGVRWNESFKGARYTVVENQSDVNLLKGSKYIDVDRNILRNGKKELVYSVVADYLCFGRKVLFIGLG